MIPKPKIIIIYESYHHQNTEKVAHIIAKKLQADLYLTDEVKTVPLSEYEVIGIGTGIYYGKPHRKIHSFLNNLPIFNGQRSFLFTTSGIIYKKYIQGVTAKIIQRIEEKGLKVIDYLSIKGWDTFDPLKLIGGINKGHPDLSDLFNEELFANKLINEL